MRSAWAAEPAHAHRLVSRAQHLPGPVGCRPDKVQAFTGLPVAANIYGKDVRRPDLLGPSVHGRGQGAWAAGDGKSAPWPTSAANTSIELFEARVPVLVIEKTYVAIGRTRRFRGGLGQRVRCGSSATTR